MSKELCHNYTVILLNNLCVSLVKVFSEPHLPSFLLKEARRDMPNNIDLQRIREKRENILRFHRYEYQEMNSAVHSYSSVSTSGCKSINKLSALVLLLYNGNHSDLLFMGRFKSRIEALN